MNGAANKAAKNGAKAASDCEYHDWRQFAVLWFTRRKQCSGGTQQQRGMEKTNTTNKYHETTANSYSLCQPLRAKRVHQHTGNEGKQASGHYRRRTQSASEHHGSKQNTGAMQSAPPRTHQTHRCKCVIAAATRPTIMNPAKADPITSLSSAVNCTMNDLSAM